MIESICSEAGASGLISYSAAGQRGKKHFKTGLHTDTWYPVQTPNLYLILTLLNKKGNYYFYFMIFDSCIF